MNHESFFLILWAITICQEALTIWVSPEFDQALENMPKLGPKFNSLQSVVSASEYMQVDTWWINSIYSKMMNIDLQIHSNEKL